MTGEEYKAILTMAIDNEVESYAFYKGVSERVVDPYIKKLFSEFAAEELGHQKLLEGFLAKDIKDMHFDESADYKVSETVDKPKLSLDMKPADALALAMKNEEDAMNMYSAFATASCDQSQKEMFHDLSIMEQGHKTKIEKYYVNVAYPEVW
ncbi:ferritin [Desulfosporosinus fructosivorans]|uniref:Ferritin n=1 Tax=Desulfosporosinus fructosivorans TaxID=2018669 RepID=A0A4Z0R636_9FIRM|nr:ferritin family protein [Desulfosporosinus fructosivorans]TGE38298.1 ferritin [Desulfosporosinus fructosivorans]